jgi:uncharacterized SAM-binding protein YcdF (DUF218 family)
MTRPGPSTNPVKKKHLLWNLFTAGAVLFLLMVLVYALHSQILTGVAEYLVVNDAPQQADVIFLLNSDYNTRPLRAAELYSQGLAPLILIARSEDTSAVKMGLIPNDTDISVGVMEKLGVPPDKIVILSYPGGVTSTFDEAAVLHQYIQTYQVRTVLLVTSAFHTRRARWIFDRELAGTPVKLEMVAVPYAGFDQTNWWKNETGLITLNNEYIKLAYYFVKYH